VRRWRAAGVASNGKALNLHGVNIWNGTWTPVDAAPVSLAHPDYPGQHHAFSLYRYTLNDTRFTFAAAEVAAGVWGFYLEDSQDIAQVATVETPEKVIRLGCGGLFGFAFGCYAAFRLALASFGWTVAIIVLSVGVCACLALRLGDRFWNSLSGRW